MSAGMYVSAAGALTNMHRLDVASNNLANVNTTAFKRDIANTTPRLPEKFEDALFHLGSDELLDRLAGGVLATDTLTDFSQGPINITGNPLDAAIDGEGFFVVEAGDGSGESWLTRDGRFTMTAQGELVSASTGLRVLGDNNAPVRIDPDIPVSLSQGGEVIQEGRVVAQLRLVKIENPASLNKTFGGFYEARNGQPLELPHDPALRIHTEAIEDSGVDPIKALMGVTSAGSGVRNNLRLMQLYDDINNQAINRLGNVTG